MAIFSQCRSISRFLRALPFIGSCFYLRTRRKVNVEELSMVVDHVFGVNKHLKRRGWGKTIII
jgi:hypothetical protein